MRKQKCKCPDPGLTAPFYLLTYGDMMTLLLTFFVLLFSMSTLQVIKFQAKVGVLQGALGISELYQHTPMQVHLPAPAVKRSSRVVARAILRPTKYAPLAEPSTVDSFDPARQSQEEIIQAVQNLGTLSKVQIEKNEDEVIITLPTYGIFKKGEYTIDPNSPEVRRVNRFYRQLAEQLSQLARYDIRFTGHTDSLQMERSNDPAAPQNNMELGFKRAVAVFDFFFADYLTDRTRISFGSQGDNIPVVPNAVVDSERRKNRRVVITLKRKPSDEPPR